jgi:hypothetical protein
MALRSLTSVLDGGERSVSRPGCFTPGKTASVIYWTGGCVGLRASLEMVAKADRSLSLPGTESQSPISQRVTFLRLNCPGLAHS